MKNAMIKKCGCAILAAACAAAFTTKAMAADYHWDNGGGDGKWFTADNWYSTESNNTLPPENAIANIGSTTAGCLKIATSVVDQAGAVVNYIKLGFNTGTTGTLIIAEGSLDVTNRIDVGVSGLGRLVLSNGIIRVTNYISVATQAAKPGGTIELAGGYIQTPVLYIGSAAQGVLTQSGGTNRITNKAYLSSKSTGQSTYELSGGLFNPSILDIGIEGTATVHQTGGVLENLGQTTMGANTNGVGIYYLENGTLDSSSLYVGNYGTATFTQTGGTNTVGNFFVLPRYNTGVYNMWGGVLCIGTNGGKSSYIAAGFDGVEGTFNFGTTNSSGVIRQAPGSTNSYIIVGYYEGVKSVFRGWGLCEMTGVLNNNGVVAADGYGTDRDLDFRPMISGLAKKFANANTNGWYAWNHGRLLLPPISAGSSVYWGDVVASGKTNDLINSVRLELTGTGSVTGALMAADHTLVKTGLHKPIGVWEFSGGAGVTAGQLTFLYDAAQLTALKIEESRLRVWRHNGDAWVNVTETGGLDTAANKIRTLSVNPFGQFAVAATVRGTLMQIQ